MRLLFIYLTVLFLGLTSCVSLKPKPDGTKTYALGLSKPVLNGLDVPIKKGYVARPQLPAYMEGYKLKQISDEGEIVNIPDARWAEPLNIGVARAVSHYIEVLNSELKCDFYPWARPDDAAFTLKLNFHQLIATSDGRIFISVMWEYRNAADEKAESGFFVNQTQKWSGDPRSMVGGVNAALELLVAEVFDTLKKETLTAK